MDDSSSKRPDFYAVFRWAVLVGTAFLCLGPFLFMLSTSFEGGDVFKLDTPLDLLPNQFSVNAYFEVFQKLPE